MGRLTKTVFDESCCDGGASACKDSAQPCGCDPKANYIAPDCHIHGYKNVYVGRENLYTAKAPSLQPLPEPSPVRTFDTGANRDSDLDKYDYEGFLSPLVLERFGAYMHKNRHMKDGSLRASDNWQKGIPRDVYIKSLWRHMLDLWMAHRGHHVKGTSIEESLTAIMFNTMGYLHEELKGEK